MCVCVCVCVFEKSHCEGGKVSTLSAIRIHGVQKLKFPIATVIHSMTCMYSVIKTVHIIVFSLAGCQGST